MARLNKFIRTDLNKETAKRMGLYTRDVGLILDCAFKVLREQILAGRTVSIRPIGQLKPWVKSERLARIPKVEQEIKRRVQAGELTPQQAREMRTDVLIPAHWEVKLVLSIPLTRKLRERAV